MRYVARLRSSADGLDHAVEAFAQTCIEFLRLQARFVKTGCYARASASELHAELYGDAEEMDGYYLDGLAMTYALWPNHAQLVKFLSDEFVPLVPSGGQRRWRSGPVTGFSAIRYCAGFRTSPTPPSTSADPRSTYVASAYEQWGHMDHRSDRR